MSCNFTWWENRKVYIMIMIPKYLVVFLFHKSISTLSLLTFSATHEHSIDMKWMAKQINKEIFKCGRECMRIEFMIARAWNRNLDPINLTMRLIIILENSFRLTLTIFNKLFEMRCCLIQRINGGFWLRKRYNYKKSNLNLNFPKFFSKKMHKPSTFLPSLKTDSPLDLIYFKMMQDEDAL